MTTAAYDPCKQDNEFSWETLQCLLSRLVKFWVYSAHMSSWQGQEEEIIADIVQEVIARVCKQLQKVELGEANPVNSIESLSKTVARHYFIDLIRRDRRLIHLSQINWASEEPGVEYGWVNLSEKVIDVVFLESFFNDLACETIRLPKKQKLALLTYLANLIDSDSMPSSLQRAFLKVGIQLQNYQLPLPDNPVERSRYRSLLYIARKRVAKSACMRQYRFVA